METVVKKSLAMCRKAAEKRYDSYKALIPDTEIYSATRSLAEIRHKAHAQGEVLLFDTKAGRQIRMDIARSLAILKRKSATYPEIYENTDIRFVLREIRETGEDALDHPDRFDDDFEYFYEMKEQLNDELTGVLKNIDRMYETGFTPTGENRKHMPDAKEKTRKATEQMYAQQLESRKRKGKAL